MGKTGEAAGCEYTKRRQICLKIEVLRLWSGFHRGQHQREVPGFTNFQDCKFHGEEQRDKWL